MGACDEVVIGFKLEASGHKHDSSANAHLAYEPTSSRRAHAEQKLLLNAEGSRFCSSKLKIKPKFGADPVRKIKKNTFKVFHAH